MNYVVALGLLVLVGAWGVAVYSQLHHLYEQVRGAWGQWLAATRHRNDCLWDLSMVVASYVPPDDMLARELRKWITNNRRALDNTPVPPHHAADEQLKNSEHHLQRLIAHMAQLLGDNPHMHGNDQLLGLYNAMSVARNRQTEAGQYYDRAARHYNTALHEPPNYLLAPLLGFYKVSLLTSTPHRKPHPQQQAAPGYEKGRES
ncbi:MAG: LemA family protein [Akkermansia sp.]|nr:LemA family protein [Akkermansia sp.]